MHDPASPPFLPCKAGTRAHATTYDQCIILQTHTLTFGLEDKASISILSPTFSPRVVIVTSLCVDIGEGDWMRGEEELVAVVCVVEVVEIVEVLLGAGDFGTAEPRET